MSVTFAQLIEAAKAHANRYLAYAKQYPQYAYADQEVAYGAIQMVHDMIASTGDYALAQELSEWWSEEIRPQFAAAQSEVYK